MSEKLPPPAIRPWIVVLGKVGAFLRAGMAVEPKFNKRAGIRVVEPGFAKVVERGNRGLLRVGNYAVDGFLPKDIGLVLEVAAHTVIDWLLKEHPTIVTAKINTRNPVREDCQGSGSAKSPGLRSPHRFPNRLTIHAANRAQNQ